MPRPRFERADPALRSAILDAAAREFAEHGYDGASLNAMLLAAGLSKGSFYYYFDDKADLAATVLTREMEGFVAEMAKLRRVDRVDEFWAEIDRYSVVSLGKLRESKQQSDVIQRLGMAMYKHPELMERCGALIAAAQQKILAFWARGQEIGAVRTDLPVAALLSTVQSIKQALATALLPADRGATADELEAFTRIQLDMLRRIAQP